MIRDKWAQLGYEGGVLGYPTTRERPTRKPGRFNHFERGSIYWSQSTGARKVNGKIRDYWAERDWENGPLGFPTSDEYAENGGVSQNFQGGKVQWFPTVTSTLPAQVNPGSYGTYSQDYQLFSPPLSEGNPAAILHEIAQHFDSYFTFTGCGQVLYVGKECRLDTTFSPDAPVRVTHITNDGFALRSLPGHLEGQDRMITFRFYQALIGTLGQYEIRMRVQAWGPLSGSSVFGIFNSETIARSSWQTFQDNIRNRFPNKGTRYVPCCGYGDVPPSGARRAPSPYPGPVEQVSPDAPVIRPDEPIAPLPKEPSYLPPIDPATGEPSQGDTGPAEARIPPSNNQQPRLPPRSR